LGGLGVETGRVWWRLWPRLIAIYAVAWTTHRLLLLMAAWAATWRTASIGTFDDDDEFYYEDGVVWNQWVSIVFVSLALLVLLIGIVLCLRALLDFFSTPDEPSGEVNQWRSLTRRMADTARLVSVVMLPFIAVYSLFDKANELASQVMVDGTAFAELDLVNLPFLALRPGTWETTVIMVAVIIGLYLLRFTLEEVAKKRGSWIFEFLAVVVEVHFLFVTFIGGTGVARNINRWIATREFSAWIDTFIAWIGRPLELIGLNLPEALKAAWAWVGEIGWPVVAASFSQPVLWLTLAGLAMGYQALAKHELVKTKEFAGIASLVANRDAVRHFTEVAGEKATEELPWLARIPATFVKDFDEQYLPSIQLVWRLLRTGAGALGTLIVLYNLLAYAQAWFVRGLDWLVGHQPFAEAMFAEYFIDLVSETLWGTLTLALLATAYQRLKTGRAVDPMPWPRRTSAVSVMAEDSSFETAASPSSAWAAGRQGSAA
jgi:hypothetical protein